MIGLTDVNEKITTLQKQQEKVEKPLRQITELEQKIKSIRSQDSANYSVQINKIRNETQHYTLNQIREELQNTKKEINQITQQRKNTQQETDDLIDDLKQIEVKQKTIQSTLVTLKNEDPANLQVQLQKLHTKWDKLNEDDLTKERADGKIAKLVKDDILINHQIKNINEKTKSLQKDIERLFRHEQVLTLKNYIYQIREIEIKNNDLQELSSTTQELTKLQKERDHYNVKINTMGLSSPQDTHESYHVNLDKDSRRRFKYYKKKRQIAIMIAIVSISAMSLALGFIFFTGNSPSLGKTGPVTVWTKTYGGTHIDFAQALQHTSDNGYILGGSTYYTTGECEILVVKTDNDGNLLWSQTYKRSRYEKAETILETFDGGYLIGGATESTHTGFTSILLIKINDNGQQMWYKIFQENGEAYLGDIQQTADGGFILVGTVNMNLDDNYDAWLIKLDSNGNKIWDKTLGGSGMEWGNAVHMTNDGGYVFAGTSSSYGNGGWIVKTNETGAEQWNITINEQGYSRIESIDKTTDGGYIITGTVNTEKNKEDVILIKISSTGIQQWYKTFGGVKQDEANEVQQTTDGGFIITGNTESYGAGKSDIWLIKTDNVGTLQWDRAYGGGNDELGYSVQQINDNQYIFTGSTRSYGNGETDFWLVKI